MPSSVLSDAGSEPHGSAEKPDLRPKDVTVDPNRYDKAISTRLREV
jgi:hypothetical protein